jgi:predicted glycoside hydrolase/deacetylase ChbG (UPF0249 family)
MMRLILGLMLTFAILCAGDDDIYLIIRGDDIGSSHAANLACIQSYREGIMRTVELMVPCPWFPEAVKMLQENPGLDVGIHLTLTSEWSNYKWGSLTHAPTLVDSNGYFFPKQKNWADENATDAFWNAKPDLKEVEGELRAQIEMALSDVPQISHLSGHMGIGSVAPEMEIIFKKLRDEYNLNIGLNTYEIQYMRGMKDRSHSFGEREASFIAMLQDLKPGRYLFVEHPGLDTPEMQAIGHTGYEDVAQDRDAVTRIFTSKKVMAVIKEKNIKLISYKDLMEKNVSPLKKGG